MTDQYDPRGSIDDGSEHTSRIVEDPKTTRSVFIRWWPGLLAAIVLVVLIGALLWPGRGVENGVAPLSTPGSTSTAETPEPTRTATKVPKKKTKESTGPGSREMSPRKPNSQATTASKLLISLSEIESVEGVAEVPGDISGPAVRVTVNIKNTTSETRSLAETVVNSYYGTDRTPADPLTSPGGRPLPTRVGPGATAEGVYLFRIPKDARSQVTVTVDTKSDEPAVVFSGQMG